MNDQKIIELLFARSEVALTHLQSKFEKYCHTVAYNILGSDFDANECVNDTYLGVWNSIPPTRPNNLMAFVCKITRNLSLKRLEAMTRQKRSAQMLLSFDELADVLSDESIAHDVSDGEIARLISDFLREEREDSRNVFIRKYYFFDSIADIAARYSFSESKVKNMLHRTRTKLKAYLIKEGVEI